MNGKQLKLESMFLLCFLLITAAAIATGRAHGAEAKKCLIVAAYHDDFPGQALKVEGARTVLKGKCEIKQFNMDTKRNPDPEFARMKALEAKAVVEEWNPDVLIAIDDNASKYLVQPHFRDTALPVVFSGVDWTAEDYGYPYPNATGMIETYPVNTLVREITEFMPDAKTAVCIRGERLSEKKDCARYRQIYGAFGIEVADRPVTTFGDFKEVFRKSQEADFVIFQNYSGISGWEDRAARDFVGENAKKLVVSQLKWMAEFSMLALTQVVEEQGEYAAEVALRILEGAKPSDFPVITNRRWKLYVNEPLLEKAGIELPRNLVHKAEKVSAVETSGNRCLFVASYHPGYPWQDGIEKGLRSVLEGKCEIRQFNMDTKRNPSEEFCVKRGLEAKALIESWRPDLVIAADDKASRCLVAPHLRDSETPVVFCGVNWTAAEYGYPYTNATGIIEVAPVLPLHEQIRTIRPGTKKGVILRPNLFSEGKTAARLIEVFNARGIEVSERFTDDMDQFEEEFLAAADSDFIYLLNNSVMKGWDPRRAKEFIFENASIPVLTMNRWMAPFAMISVTHVPEEQGEYAAEVALRILDGAEPLSIPIITNRKWNAFVNKPLLEKAGIKIPATVLQQAENLEYLQK